MPLTVVVIWERLTWDIAIPCLLLKHNSLLLLSPSSSSSHHYHHHSSSSSFIIIIIIIIITDIFNFLCHFQDLLRCIGGMKIFLPLLEQISYFQPSTRCHGYSEQLKLFDLEKSTDEKVAGILERYLSDLQDLKRLGA